MIEDSGRHRWKDRRYAIDKPHTWSALSATGIVTGTVELRGNRFVALDSAGRVVGNYATLFDARAALTQARR
jgi:hypothetical protein